MRVIGGKYGGKKFQPPSNFKGRPTTDFAREALFNILRNRLDLEDCQVLDLFAGAGGITFEFISQGAQSVLAIEKARRAAFSIRKTMEDWGESNVQVLAADVFTFLKTTKSEFDIVFADPPFKLENLNKLPEIIKVAGVIGDEGLLILEHGPEHSFKNHPNLEVERKYGHVRFSFFTFNE